MISKNNYTGINSEFVKAVRDWARRLKRDKAFAHDYIEDVEQDLFLGCLPSLKEYDALEERYIKQYVKCWALNLREKMLRKKRAINFVNEVNDALDKKEGESFECNSVVHIDVNETIEKLPAKKKKICELLKECKVSEISKKTGIAKQTIYSIVKSLRKDFVHLNP